MTFKLDSEYAKITSPIILHYSGQEIHLNSGKDLVALTFDVPLEVEKVYAQENIVVIILNKKNPNPTEDWTNKEVSFFN